MKREDIVGVCEGCGDIFFDLDEIVRTTFDRELCVSCVFYEAYEIYKKEGYTGVFNYADGSPDLNKWAYCEPCDNTCPVLDGSCLVCGSSIEEVK
jgi:hypothetical protein